MSLNSGIIPYEWKTAHVVPVFEKGRPEEVSNYRPISLLCVISKVLERCLHNYIYQITRNDIDINQHGFMNHRSTSTQLIQFYDNIYKVIDRGKQTEVIYLSKAFDCVSHKLLLYKLKSFGFSGMLLQWIKTTSLEENNVLC